MENGEIVIRAGRAGKRQTKVARSLPKDRKNLQRWTKKWPLFLSGGVLAIRRLLWRRASRESRDDMKVILDPESATPTYSELKEAAAFGQLRPAGVRKRRR
jgi:hypothetical protein